MPQSLTNLLVHLVFSTKNRTRFIDAPVRPELYAYCGGILRDLESPALAIGGTDDHIHILCGLSKKLAPCKLVEEIKRGSSRWIKGCSNAYSEFYWQNGYGMFSVSESNRDSVTTYIASQEEHHRRMTFQDEFRQFLEKHRISYNEQYVWD